MIAPDLIAFPEEKQGTDGTSRQREKIQSLQMNETAGIENPHEIVKFLTSLWCWREIN